MAYFCRQKWIWALIWGGVLLTGIAASGCTSVISSAVLKKIHRDISFEAIKKDPDAYEGDMVLLAGVIVKTTIDANGATLEIYQTDMDWEQRPKDLDESKGRFLAHHDRFLDPEIYSKGRQVTVAGEIVGTKIMKLGAMDYPYPLLRAEEIHLWKKEKSLPSEAYSWYPMGDGYPWGGWGFWPWYPWYY